MPLCKICGETKEQPLFRKQASYKSGYANICKECRNKRDIVWQRNYDKTEKGKEVKEKASYKYNHSKKGQLSNSNNTIEYRKNNKSKVYAHRLINQGVNSGLIIKPEGCELCGSHERLDGHHWDYKQPLSVIWCCRQCHADIHNDRLEEPK